MVKKCTCPLPRCMCSLHHQSGALVTTDEPALTHHHHPKSTFTVGSLLVLSILWVWTNVQWHVSFIIVSYRALSLPWKSSVHVFMCPPAPSNHWSFYCLYSLAFSRMSHNWHHTSCSFSRLSSLSNIHLSFLHMFSWLDDSFPFSVDNTPLPGWTTVYPFTYQKTSWWLPCNYE